MKKEERVNMSHLHCLSLVFALLLPSGAGASAQESQRTALLYSKKNLNLDATITFTLENDRSGSAELVQVRCRTEGRFRESEIAPWQPIPGKTGEDLNTGAWPMVPTGGHLSLRLAFGADGLATLEAGVGGGGAGSMVAVFRGLRGPLCASVDLNCEAGLRVRVGGGTAPAPRAPDA